MFAVWVGRHDRKRPSWRLDRHEEFLMCLEVDSDKTSQCLMAVMRDATGCGGCRGRRARLRDASKTLDYVTRCLFTLLNHPS
jgi:hypothetical protein